ncbi:MFS transporter [Salmonella enterica subsp. enterica serovar Newport]|nr:MFS transporter [Salmonella enterica subsp. enterica serovar Newport]
MSSPQENLYDAIRIVKRKIIPLAFILYFFNYMDRVNIGFAALRMNESLGITPEDFANISSIFFISYLIFQIPSSIGLQKLGARKWISSIIIGWGAVTGLIFFAKDTQHILLARIFLGVFEAGFFPGMVYYLACWFPARERGKVNSFFMLSIAVASVLAAPMSGWIIEHLNTPDYEGWRWLFAIEGIPTVFLGILTFYLLPDSPEKAKWLTPQQISALVNKLRTDNETAAALNKNTNSSFLSVIKNPVLLQLSFAYMLIQAAALAANYWLPGLVKGFSADFTDTDVGLIMSIPFIFAMFSMPWWGWHSDKKNERKWHAALPMFLAGCGFLMIALVPSVSLRMLGLTFYGVGILSYYGPYWALPSALLSPSGVAISIAFINSCSSLGGFLINKSLGFVSTHYGATGIFIVEAILCFAAVAVLALMKIDVKKEKSQQTNVVSRT